MRAAWFLGLTLIVGCGKQLNPQYCAANPTDPDCQTAGIVVDATPRCVTDSDCPGAVCDVSSGGCVQCITSSQCQGNPNGAVCNSDDTCVGCESGSDCTSGVCLPDNTCAGDNDTILYAAPGGSGTTCTDSTQPCTLTNAVSKAGSGGQTVIELIGSGTFDEGTINLNVDGLQIVVKAGVTDTITGSKSGDPVLNVTASVSMSQITIDKSNGDGIDCTNNATLVADQMVISNSGNSGVDANDCTLTLTRSKLFGNNEAAVTTSGGTNVISVLNNFMYDNGTPTSFESFGYTGGGAVSLSGKTSGQVRFNTIAFNVAADIPGLGKHDPDMLYPAAFACGDDVPSDFNLSDNLVVQDLPEAYDTREPCGNQSPTGANWVGSDASSVFFMSTDSGSMDLHLTTKTPDQQQGGVKAIRDNPDTNCMNVLDDYDGDSRPQNQACDYGADELTSTVQ
ncbi:MAG TPA: hypothetical protein VGL61_31130 [Kofleriaceae bacterium]|jgi:hypothetical protein